ncbi:MAG: D-tyrosyl-tRNA(Tyr) deacylase [Puniceicoccales bacterium]|jgi:D-tyrosyl-tRNA(Tyr) deacylase|nr:D-tyrosyl-tRNA(Tyr) deacylase [Puniceicoccales bacterium]
MRAVIQRVTEASVSVNSEVVGAIGRGFLVLLGVEAGDTDADRDWLVDKISKLRLFDDATGRMNLALGELAGEDGNVLLVSQFTLFGSVRKGTRPSYHRAALPEVAECQYEEFAQALSRALGKVVQTGVFGEMMQVRLLNDGPVTLMLDSRNKDF